jgi:16S rRNA (guanine966-N2)-methyltransferase
LTRVTGGALRGRRLATPPNARTRPTLARVRQALFAALEHLPGGQPAGSVLDLYAGSGALGVEAVSRGWQEVWFVERDPAALQALRRNVQALGLAGRARVLAWDVVRFLASPAFAERRFDLVFVDPPYAVGPRPVLERLGAVAPGRIGLVVAHHPLGEELPAAVGNLVCVWRRRYGRAGLAVYAGGRAGGGSAGNEGSAAEGGPVSGQL